MPSSSDEAQRTCRTTSHRTGPKLLDRVRDAIRTRHYSRRTEEAYVHWIRRYIVFHGKKHPAEMGAGEISRFLTSLAVVRRVSASTQNQALSALLFLYELGMSGASRLVVVAYAERPPRTRIISTRLATGHERRKYENDQGKKKRPPMPTRCAQSTTSPTPCGASRPRDMRRVRMWWFSSRTLRSCFQTAGQSTRHYGRWPGWLASHGARRLATKGRHNIALHPTAAMSGALSRRG